MISLVYVSTAIRLMTTEELLEILHVSRVGNKEKDVTGMLLYKGGNFMQVLEGPEDSVMKVFKSIQADTRHKDVSVLGIEPIKERQFSEWTMAFHNLDEQVVKTESAFSEFLNDELIADKYRKTPNLAYIMLLSFRDNMR